MWALTAATLLLWIPSDVSATAGARESYLFVKPRCAPLRCITLCWGDFPDCYAAVYERGEAKIPWAVGCQGGRLVLQPGY
jgi:hypothetical protein